MHYLDIGLVPSSPKRSRRFRLYLPPQFSLSLSEYFTSRSRLACTTLRRKCSGPQTRVLRNSPCFMVVFTIATSVNYLSAALLWVLTSNNSYRFSCLLDFPEIYSNSSDSFVWPVFQRSVLYWDEKYLFLWIIRGLAWAIYTIAEHSMEE